jgi:diguanylate cyclase (GGDEF)-like protein
MKSWGAAVLLLLAGAAFAAPEPSDLPFGGRFAFRTYGEDDGLGNLTIECLLQDRQGFLWVGTQDGLFRFDGRRFVRFGREQGLPSSRVNTLHQAGDGLIYAGTREGVAVWDGVRLRGLGVEEGLPRVSIPDQGIASDAAGTLFVATPQGLFVRQKQGRFRLEPPGDPSLGVEVTGLHVDPRGALWFGRGPRLFRRAGGKVEEAGRALGLTADERIDQIVTDFEGRLWVRTISRLWALPPCSPRSEDVPEPRFARDDEGLPSGVATGRLELDDRGRLMVPTERGLARKQDGRWRLLGGREGLESDTVLSALVDREGSLWIGLAGVGLAQQLGRGAFTSWGSSEGLSHDVVWSIARSREGAYSPDTPLWIGTEDGLNQLDLATGAVRVLKEEDGLAGNTVYSVRIGPDGSVWAGSWPGGITRLGPEPGRVRRYLAEGLAAADFKLATIYLDRAGNLWGGSSKGVFRLDAGSSSTVLRPVRVPRADDDRDGIYGFAEDRHGTVWAVGRYGLQRLTGPAPRRFRQGNGLLADFLGSIVPAAPGEPWDLIAGYREALGAAGLKIEGDRLRVDPIQASTGLSFDKVLFLGRDARGALWLGGGAGVDVFPRPGRRPIHFGRASGLITEDMSQNAFLAEPDGSVWLGTSRGLVRYRPGAAAGRPAPPPILLTEARAGGQALPLATPADTPVRLEHGQRDVRISWAAPTFLEPHRVRYRYRLAGLEESWNETAASEVRFPALPTGRYRFEVLAVSGRGLASARPAVLSFSVAPAWWESWWAWGAAALLLGLGTAGMVRLRTRSLEQDRRRLEAAVAERSAALAAAVRELEEASFTDPLTRVRNRRFLTSIIEGEAERAIRAPDGRGLVAYLIDVDHFKSVNDQHGHRVGDALLVQVAARLSSVIRGGDLLVRWGGEEFLVIARDARRDEAEELASRLLGALAGSPFDLGDGTVLTRTCSLGWAPFPWFPEAPRTLTFDQVLTLADHALYVAKRSGRNRAVGALPEGNAAEVVGRFPDWWQEPLEEGEGRWVRLLRTGTGEEVPARGNFGF